MALKWNFQTLWLIYDTVNNKRMILTNSSIQFWVVYRITSQSLVFINPIPYNFWLTLSLIKKLTPIYLACYFQYIMTTEKIFSITGKEVSKIKAYCKSNGDNAEASDVSNINYKNGLHVFTILFGCGLSIRYWH